MQSLACVCLSVCLSVGVSVCLCVRLSVRRRGLSKSVHVRSLSTIEFLERDLHSKINSRPTAKCFEIILIRHLANVIATS